MSYERRCLAASENSSRRARQFVALICAVGGFGVFPISALAADDSAQAEVTQMVKGLPATTLGLASGDFCGVLVESNAGLAHGCNGISRNRWTYVSNRYKGGGNIDRMRAWMTHSGANASAGKFYYYAWLDNATFMSECYYGNFKDDIPYINQYEASGASHTLYGHSDSSNGHSNCVPENLV